MNELNVIATAKYLDANSIEHVVTQWGLSNQESNALRLLINYRDEGSKLSVKKLIDLVMSNTITQEEAKLILNFDGGFEAIREWGAIVFPEFPIRGQDLLDLGLKGKAIGDTLKSLRFDWVASHYSLTKEDLIANVIID